MDPKTEVKDEAQVTNPQVEQTPVSNVTRLKPLIMIIEDESLITNMYTKKLTLDGYDCITVGDGGEGVRLTKEKLPDLILCDIMMPIKDGITTLKELKAEESTKSIPMIMLSNLADQKYVDEALELGAVSYLIKSDTVPSDVVVKVKEVLEAKGKKSLLTKAA